MAFFQLILNARELEKARQDYHDEKLESIEISKGLKTPNYTLSQKIRLKKIQLKKKINELIDKWLENLWIHKKIILIKTDGTFENSVVKSILGFFGGIILAYIFFIFFVYQLNFATSSAAFLCSIIGVILTLGLAFSLRIRCFVFLLLPQLFSKRGRQALMAYAFILALTGPAKNTLQNIGVLAESLACGQEQLKEAVKAIIDLVKQPFYALRDSIGRVIKIIQGVVKKIEETLLSIKKMIISILNVIKSVSEWLESIVNVCNKKLGTPFERCEKVFEGAVADCQANLGPHFGDICNLANVVGAMCYAVKPIDFICILVTFVTDTIVDSVRKKLKKFSKHMKTMFYVKINFSHSFDFETKSSKTLDEVANDIVSEIHNRTDKFLKIFDCMSFLSGFFVLFIFLRIISYRHKWLTNDRFDNQYITNYLRDIDLVRAKKDQETVLPLNTREKGIYIPLTSLILIKSEKINLAKSAVFLSLTTFKLCIHMMVDYSLYWILNIIRYHGEFSTKKQQINSVGIVVTGDSYSSQLYRNIINAFTPSNDDVQVDSLPCLPNPLSPDFDRYTQILSLIVFCWILALFEPYGLRLRQIVMEHYHPERAKQRAVWLYNHILRSRGGFIKYARRQMRRKYGTNDDKDSRESVTFKQHIFAVIPILNRFFDNDEKVCLLCGTSESNKNNKTPHIKCPTPGCIGLFCIQCFSDLQNLCTICKAPMDYGDLSDISQERDSSDDEPPGKMFSSVKKKLKTKEDKRIEDNYQDTKVSFDGDKSDKIDKIENEIQDKEDNQTDESQMVTDKIEYSSQKVYLSNEIYEDEYSESNESDYSQSYQYEQSREIIPLEVKLSHRDVEAQKVRDDVTIQIFKETLRENVGSSHDNLINNYGIDVKKTFDEKNDSECPCSSASSSSLSSSSSTTTTISSTSMSESCTDSDSSTSSISEEEMIQIEIDDDIEGKAVLGAGGSRILRKTPARIQTIVDVLNEISRKKTSRPCEDSSGTLMTSRVIELLYSRFPELKHNKSIADDCVKLIRQSSSLSIDNNRSRIKNKNLNRERGGKDNKNRHVRFLKPLKNVTKYFEINELADKYKKKYNKAGHSKDSSSVDKNVPGTSKSHEKKSQSSKWYDKKNIPSFGIKKKIKKKLKSMKEDFRKNKLYETSGDESSAGEKQDDPKSFKLKLKNIKLKIKDFYKKKKESRVKSDNDSTDVDVGKKKLIHTEDSSDVDEQHKNLSSKSDEEKEINEFITEKTDDDNEKEKVEYQNNTNDANNLSENQTDDLSSNTSIQSPNKPTKPSPTSPANSSPSKKSKATQKNPTTIIRRKRKKCKQCSKSKKKYCNCSDNYEKPGQKVTGFRPIIYPIPCCHQAQVCVPGPGYDPNEWFQLNHQYNYPCCQKRNQITRDTSTTTIPMYNPNEIVCPSTSRKPNLPVLRKFLPLFQTPELVEELEERDRLRFIEEQIERGRIDDAVKINEPYRCPGINSQVRCPSQLVLRPSKIARRSEGISYRDTRFIRNSMEEFKQMTHLETVEDCQCDDKHNKSTDSSYSHVIDLSLVKMESQQPTQLLHSQDDNFLTSANTENKIVFQEIEELREVFSPEVETQSTIDRSRSEEIKKDV